MGCNCINSKREFYTDIDNDEEMYIRKWEEDFGAFSKTWANLRSRIWIQQELCEVDYAEKFFQEQFSASILPLIRCGYFTRNVHGTDYYDSRKILLLTFLFSRHSQQSNSNQKYYDKTSFIFAEVFCSESEDMCLAIEKENGSFLKLLNELFDITVNGITSN